MTRRRWTLLRGRAVSLRRRLIAGMLALVAVGLFASGAVTYWQMQRLMVGRVATAVVATARAAGTVVGADRDRASTIAGRRGLAAALQPLLDADEVLVWQPSGGADPVILGTGLTAAPVRDHLIANLVGTVAYDPAPDTALVSSAWPTVHSIDHIDYQVAVQQTSVGPVVVAASMADADHLVYVLLTTEVGVGGLLLVVLACLGVVVVRQGLRPLDAIVATAVAITGGDRGQRVPLPPGDSEVGRVSAALNQMLEETETSYAAARASEARMRQFIGDASHELRTPLASVRSYAELLRSGAADAPADRALAVRRIESESARMSELVEDLLLLARLDAGRPLHSEPVDLDVLVREAVTDENTIDPSRCRELIVSGDVVVVGDAARLRQVVANLLDNARTHTPPGTAITVELHGPPTGPPPDRPVRLVVTDRGPGLTEDQRDRVFERFYRGDASRTRHADTGTGTGLGLAIVTAIVTAHDGTVEAAPAPGGGARFTVTLPAQPSARSGG